VKVSNLQTCIDHLRRANIESKSPVYQPLHRYFDLSASDFPHAEMAQQQILSLPFHPGLDDDDIHRVVRELVAIAEPTCD
jgi:dTDP-4-amino-4,6-dideoxygalactose transaminase